MSSDESILKLFRFEHMIDQVEQNETNKEERNGNFSSLDKENDCFVINGFFTIIVTFV